MQRQNILVRLTRSFTRPGPIVSVKAAIVATAATVGMTAAMVTTAAGLPSPWLPRDPGAARCRVTNGMAELQNSALRFAVRSKGNTLELEALDNAFTGEALPLHGELFAVTQRGADDIPSSRFQLIGQVSCTTLEPQPASLRAYAQRKGAALEADLVDPTIGLTVHWRAVLRDGANYLREEVRLQPAHDLDLATLQLIDLDEPGATVAGTAAGSPIIAGNRFFGFEFPMAEAFVVGGHATMTLKRRLPIRANRPVEYTAAYGVAPGGQMRRAFLAYLEDSRAHPFRPFLHYNSWYDIGYFNRYTESEALHAIDGFGEEMSVKRGVKVDSFLFDDGWDDPARLWQFNSSFPDGFQHIREAAARFGAAPGIWLSPWGGYGQPRKERLAAARAQHYAVDEQGIALSDPAYYRLFQDATAKLLRDHGINQFKFDGTGSPDKVTPGADFDSDFAAAITLIEQLRAIQPGLFVNLTTGTWPSPYWLDYADSIWRGGEDHSFAGVGTDRQRWITYRDAVTYGGIVRLGPLYPLNALMLHGIIFARHAKGLNSDPHDDFADEVHSYFASGTGLQELYISPDLLTSRQWDTLAESARWARDRAAVLRDSHWIGGDPARLEVYGWASWTPEHAVLALRNPSQHAQTFPVDLVQFLELPADAAGSWRVFPTFAHVRPRVWQTGRPELITLQPFEVSVWDLYPERGAARTAAGQVRTTPPVREKMTSIGTHFCPGAAHGSAL